MKRFTETLKWSRPWFRKLNPKQKLLWQWLCDNCDGAGVIDPDWDLASLQIGVSVTPEDLDVFDGRVVAIQCGKYWLATFIEFQCGRLSRDCKPHAPIFASLEKHGINPDSISDYERVSERVSERVCNTPQEKEKEKDKESEKENPTPKGKPKARAASAEDAESFCLSIGCAAGQGEAFFWKMEGNGWMNAGRPVKDWQATIRAWKAAGYLPSATPSQPANVTYIQQEARTFTEEDTIRSMGGDDAAVERARALRAKFGLTA